jgi:hypothetical protein
MVQTHQKWKYIPNDHKLCIPNCHTLRMPNGHKIFQMIIEYSNIFHSKALQNLPEWGFLVWKQTIWQPWYKYPFKKAASSALISPGFLGTCKSQCCTYFVPNYLYSNCYCVYSSAVKVETKAISQTLWYQLFKYLMAFWGKGLIFLRRGSAQFLVFCFRLLSRLPVSQIRIMQPSH